jgi:hypothetical protein
VSSRVGVKITFDHGTAVSIKRLPVMKQKKEKNKVQLRKFWKKPPTGNHSKRVFSRMMKRISGRPT